MAAIKRKRMLWYLFRAPVYLYRWRLGWLFGNRLLLLTHTGRRTGLRTSDRARGCRVPERRSRGWTSDYTGQNLRYFIDFFSSP